MLPERGVTGFVAIDASSLRGDAFTFIGGRVDDGLVRVETVDGWEGNQLRQVSLHKMVEQISKCAKGFGTRFVFGDQREEAALTALFSEHKIVLRSYAWSESSKDVAVMFLRRLMRDRKLILPDHARLRREMLQLKARLMPSGRTKYETNGLDFVSAVITLAHAALDNQSRLMRSGQREPLRAPPPTTYESAANGYGTGAFDARPDFGGGSRPLPSQTTTQLAQFVGEYATQAAAAAQKGK